MSFVKGYLKQTAHTVCKYHCSNINRIQGDKSKENIVHNVKL